MGQLKIEQRNKLGVVFNLQIQIVVSARSLLFSFHYYLLSKKIECFSKNDKEKREKNQINFKA